MTAAEDVAREMVLEVYRKVYLQVLLYGEVIQCGSCGHIFDSPDEVHECGRCASSNERGARCSRAMGHGPPHEARIFDFGHEMGTDAWWNLRGEDGANG